MHKIGLVASLPRLGLVCSAPKYFSTMIKPTLQIMGLTATNEGGDFVPLRNPQHSPFSAVRPAKQGLVIRNVKEAKEYGIGTKERPGTLIVEGTGHRNADKVPEAIAQMTGVDVIAARSFDSRFFHTDVWLYPLADGVLLFPETLSQETIDLFHFLYPNRVVYLSEQQAEAYGANGRLLRCPLSLGEVYNSFYTDVALDRTFFKSLAEMYSGVLSSSMHYLPQGGEFEVHRLSYQRNKYDTVNIRFVPMPTEEDRKGGGAVSCTTLSTAHLGLVVVPPTHYVLTKGLNPFEDKHAGTLNLKRAHQHYATQVARFRLFGHKVTELTPDPKLPEQRFTRDTGRMFGKDAQGKLHDVSAFKPNKPFVSEVFISAKMAHPLREKEVGVMMKKLKQEYTIPNGKSDS